MMAGVLKRNLFVVLLKSSKILTGLRELALLHSLSDIPKRKIPLHTVLPKLELSHQ